MGLEPFPRPRAVDKCILADYNMRSSFRPTDLVLLSSTIVPACGVEQCPLVPQ